MPYIPGMPVFCTHKIATELGLSKGSLGTLISLTYEDHNGRRYAVSATVDFSGYKGTPSDPHHPTHVVLQPVSETIKFKSPNSERVYIAKEHNYLLFQLLDSPPITHKDVHLM